jgi:PPOX class probable F420-dependent enzyme
MPDYGVAGPTAGSGLLPWTWAAERLERSPAYWVATIHADGRPHVTPVWGVWDGAAFWFSCGPRSRKARNLDRDPRATVTTSDPDEPVILEGTMVREPGRAANEAFAERVAAKYGGGSTVDFFLANATYRLTPSWAMGLREADFTGSPTRWKFDQTA